VWSLNIAELNFIPIPECYFTVLKHDFTLTFNQLSLPQEIITKNYENKLKLNVATCNINKHIWLEQILGCNWSLNFGTVLFKRHNLISYVQGVYI